MSGKQPQAKQAAPKPAISLSQPGLLQRSCECGGVPGLTGECEECSNKRLSGQRGTNPPGLPGSPPDDPSTQIQRSPLPGYSFGKLEIAPKERLGIQTKLAIGQPGDRYEQEADRVADQVMRMPAPDASARGPLVNSNLPLAAHPLPVQKQEVKEEDEEKKKGKIQAKEESGQIPRVTAELEQQLQVSQGRGQPLPEETRSFMESRFGQDFSQVRIHADPEAAQMNRALNAQAFTHRQDVFFGAGKYSPGLSEGQRLLAHELTHTVQQQINNNSPTLQRIVAYDVTQKPVDKEFALNLDDKELEEQVNIIRNNLKDLAPGTDKYNLLKSNLDILEQEAARRFGRNAAERETLATPPTAPKVRTEYVQGEGNIGSKETIFVDDLAAVEVHSFLTKEQFKHRTLILRHQVSTYSIGDLRFLRIDLLVSSEVSQVANLRPRTEAVLPPYVNLAWRKVTLSTQATKSAGTQTTNKSQQPVEVKPAVATDNPYRLLTIDQRAEKIQELLNQWWSGSEILKVFQSCRSPSEFIEIQEKVDMKAVIDKLDDWEAVQLGSLGPVTEGEDELNQKRADYIVRASHDYGLERAQVFIIYMLNSMYTNDIEAVLTLLANDKRLTQTILKMDVVKDVIKRHGIDINKFVDRGFKASDVGRAIWGGLGDILGSSEAARGGVASKYYREQFALPKEYQGVLGKIEEAQLKQALSPGNVALGAIDYVTMGIPLGIIGLVTGTVHGLKEVVSGDTEEGIKELVPAMIVALTFLGVRAFRAPKGTAKTATQESTLYGPKGSGQFVIRGYTGPITAEAARLGALLGLNAEAQGAAGVLMQRLGKQGVIDAARYIQRNSKSAVFVSKKGIPALEALVKAEGDLAKAEAMLPQSPKQLGPGPTPPKQLGPGPEPPKQLGPGPTPPKQLEPGPEPPKQLGPGPTPPKQLGPASAAGPTPSTVAPPTRPPTPGPAPTTPTSAGLTVTQPTLGATTTRTPRPGDADYTGPQPPKSWRLTEQGMGAHLIERQNVSGRSGFSMYDQPNTPRFYPSGSPENAGQAHLRLHRAVSQRGLSRQGGNPNLNESQLVDSYRRAYSDPALKGIRGDLRTPDGSNVIARDVTPLQAFEALLKWGQQ